MVLAHDISKGDRTKDVKITQNITFETMLLAPNTIKGLKDSGFLKPSPIQLYGIPIGKCGFDLLLEAKSGTGKTAVFAIIALEKLDFRKGLQVVILTPTREIAAQICDVLKQIGSRYKELEVEVVMGGLPVQDDIEKFEKRVHIVVGSPGRLKQLILNNHIDTSSVRLFVLDEADKLMEKSFQTDIKYIYSALPKQKQVIMSSATYPESSRTIINSYVQNANHVCPDSDSILLGIEQKVSFVKYNHNIIKNTQERFKELQQILSSVQFKQCVVFCNYQARVAEVNKLLKKHEWPSQKLHGQQEQMDRLDALKTLQQYKCRILVCTDLAARGIDASNIDLVVNFEPPYDWQTYLHRIGRAGRFGSYGIAITILSEGKEEQNFKNIFKLMNLSLNMRHLWTDEEFDIDSLLLTPEEQCSSPVDEVDDNKNKESLEKTPCTDMWKLLSSERNVSDTQIFKTHCDLQRKPDTVDIEPFSELIVSLEDNNYVDGDDVVFKHMQMFKTLDFISLASQNITKNINDTEELKKTNNGEDACVPEQSNGLNDVETNAFINNSNNITDTTTQEKQPDEQNDIINSTLLPSADSSTNSKNHYVKRKRNKLLQNIKSVPKSKTNNYKINPVHDNMNLRFEKREKLQNRFEISAVNNIQVKWNPHIERKILHENGSEVDEIRYESDNLIEKEYNVNNQQQQDNSRSHIRKHALKSHEKLRTSANSYTEWYNILKMRMAYIQQVVYIDEMSRF